ncbi:hypothetical protein Tco_1469285, partial [Tanacetum coccineum]
MLFVEIGMDERDLLIAELEKLAVGSGAS